MIRTQPAPSAGRGGHMRHHDYRPVSTTSETEHEVEAWVEGRSRNEGKITSKIEKQTARVPSMTFLNLAVGSMVASAILYLMGRRESANFVGLLAPSFLVI